MEEKYGFIYIWRDKGKDRWYVGCHWGREDDGYICSSNWTRMSYKRRPQDFKRRILSRIYTNKEDLLNEEYRWLQMIKKEELGKRYYNLRNMKFHNHLSKGFRWTDEYRKNWIASRLGHEVNEATREKLRQANLGKTYSTEINQKKGGKGELNPFYNKKHSQETKNHLSRVRKGKLWSEARRKAQINKRNQQENAQ